MRSTLLTVALLATLVLGSAGSAAARPAVKADPSWGGKGWVGTAFGASPDRTRGSSIAVRGFGADGGVYVHTAISFRDEWPRLDRLTPTGALDPGFRTWFDRVEAAGAEVTVLADGSLLATRGRLVRKLGADGRPIPGFGRGGRLRLERAGGAITPSPDGGFVVAAGRPRLGRTTISLYSASGERLRRSVVGGEIRVTDVSPTRGIAYLESIRYDEDIDPVGQDQPWVLPPGAKPVRIGDPAEPFRGFSFLPGDRFLLFPWDGGVTVWSGAGPDPEFEPEGEIPFSARAGGADRQGRIVVSGEGGSLARLTADGRLDPAFGDGGVVESALPSGPGHAAISFDPFGRIVAAAWQPEEGGPVLRRFLEDGSPDSGFGLGGKATFSRYTPDSAQPTHSLAMPGGRLLVAGPGRCNDRTCGYVALARYRRDGSLDPSFGRAGRAKVDVGRKPAVAHLGREPDGSLVVIGTAIEPDGESPSGFRLAIPADGRPGDGGPEIRRYRLAGATAFSAATPGPDGTTLVGGSACCESGSRDWLVARLLPDGTVDPAFGDGGSVAVDVGRGGSVAARFEDEDRIVSLDTDRRGRILLLGTSTPRSANPQPVAARLSPEGRPDRSFGRKGTWRPFLWKRQNRYRVPVVLEPRRIEALPGGRILVLEGRSLAWHRTISRRPRTDTALVWLGPDGRPDRGRRRPGAVGTRMLDGRSMSLDRCGRITVAGSVAVGRKAARVGVVRFDRRGRLDRRFARRPAVLRVRPAEAGAGTDLTAVRHGRMHALGLPPAADRPDSFGIGALRVPPAIARCRG